MSPSDAIEYVLQQGYQDYMEKKHLDPGKIELLKLLAKHEIDVRSFLERMHYLETRIKNGFESQEGNPVILSTIHSSKGLEYDTVYMVDVYDGRFPSSRPNKFSRSKDNADGEQEERRLFYVGITRAKNHLFFFNIENKHSSFIEELFPSIRAQREAAERRRIEEARSRLEKEKEEQRQRQREEFEAWSREMEARRLVEEEEREKRLQAKKKEQAQRQEQLDLKCKEEILQIIDQQEYQARDSEGRRWVRCEICGEVKQDKDFASYGGPNHVNLGICAACARKSRNRTSS
jgi:ATP-dependent exoDNAse (exonuclease V) beta subunit